MPKPRIRWTRVLMVSVPIAVAATILIPYVWALFNPPRSIDAGGPGRPTGTPFIHPGIIRPPIVAAADAKLVDEDEVIGVLANDAPRAYRLKAMRAMTDHLVNDVVHGVPVSVTYCTRCNFVQVFSAASRGKPLDLWIGGWTDQMLLKCDAGFFWQQTGKLTNPDLGVVPFDIYPHERTTWKEWRTAFPATEVYVGK